MTLLAARAVPQVSGQDGDKPSQPGAARFATRPWSTALLLGLLGLPAFLALARLWLGPWYHTWNPLEVNLLEGLPAAWEVSYYTGQFPNFLGSATPRFGIALVHYRTFSTLYLTTLLYAWTGSAYLSFALVDVLFWGLAGIATYHLALRLRFAEPTALLAALLVEMSPLFISHMWRNDLHPANFASMVLGAWAAVTLIDSRLRPVSLSLALGAVLILLGLNYSYQWISMPLVGVLCLTRPTTFDCAPTTAGSLAVLPFSEGKGPGVRSLLQAAAVTLGAIALYFAGTRALEWLFATTVGPATEWTTVASQPGSLIVDRLRAIRTPLDALGFFGTRYLVQELIDSYTPLVLVAGLAGSMLHSRRLAALTLVGLAVSLFSLGSYSAPWAATIAYPYVYLGAAHAAIAAGRLVRHLWLRRATITLIIAAMIVPTNLDLFGNTSFLLRWWAYFAGRYLF